MLIYFKVGNYKSIKEPVVINFAATAISEHADTHIATLSPKESLLKSILLYGPNASGKSKILEAFLDYRWLITSSATKIQGNESLRVEPFLLNTTTKDQPSYFEASFILDGIKYRYGFEADKDSIRKEWLLETKAIKEYPLFLRMGEEFEIDEKRFKDAEGLQKRTRKNALFISVASQWNVSKAEKINDWFNGILTIHGLMDNMYEDLTINMLEDEKYKKNIKDFICKADLGIIDLDIYDVPLQDIMNNPEYNDDVKSMVKGRFKGKKPKAVITWHKAFDGHNKEVQPVPFMLGERESEGTKKYFNLIGALILALEKNRMVVIDEFDARFHSLLSKAIIQLFNSNTNGSTSQLLIASHDTALLDRDLLRRDQIYFVEKDRFAATGVTSLVEFKIRKEAPYDKNYLSGKFGAIPMIDNLESALDDE